jgi:hypothetical protein
MAPRTKTAMGTRTIPTLISTSSLGRPETDARWPNAAKRASAFHIGIPMMRVWTRIAKLFAAVILAMASVAAGAPRAADDSTFGAKPWLLATATHEANASSEAPGLRLQVKPAARDTQVGVEQAAFQHPLDQSPQDVPQRTLPNRACDQASATALGRDPAMSEAHWQKGPIKPGAKSLSS